MFNFFRKKKEQDPKKALEDASNQLNKGITGGMTRAFMGKDFVNQMNKVIGMGDQVLDDLQIAQNLAQNGADGTAVVISISDTGMSLSGNPLAMLEVKVTPASGNEFQTTAQVIIPRLAIPRPGDKIKVKYNPDNHSQLAIV